MQDLNVKWANDLRVHIRQHQDDFHRETTNIVVLLNYVHKGQGAVFVGDGV